MYPAVMVELVRQEMKARQHQHRHVEDGNASSIALRVKRLARRGS